MTSPNHPYLRAHTLDARHPRALFPAPVPTDSRPTIGVLALQGDVREHSLALEAAGARPVVVRRAADLGDAPGDRLDGLVIPGGESTTMSTLLLAFDMLAPLRELIGAGLPAYGSCAGMIMLASALGGPRPHPGREARSGSGCDRRDCGRRDGRPLPPATRGGPREGRSHGSRRSSWCSPSHHARPAPLR